MNKYLVEITETLQRQIELEATTRDEAEHIVRLLYDNERIVLDSNDYLQTEYSVFNLPNEKTMNKEHHHEVFK